MEIRLNTYVTMKRIKELSPVAVFVATGAVPIIPNLEGVNLPNVYTAEQVLQDNLLFEDQDVVIVGSGLTGMETAEMLAENGSNISMIEMQPDIGAGLLKEILEEEKKNLYRYNPKIYTRHQLMCIKENGVEVKNLATEEIKFIRADKIVLSLGVRPKDGIDEREPWIFVVGDAEKGGRICDAIRSGFSQAYAFVP